MINRALPKTIAETIKHGDRLGLDETYDRHFVCSRKR